MIDAVTSVGLVVAGWLATYVIHSTLLLGAAWLVARRLPERPDLTSPLWKIAAIGGLLTASMSTGLAVDPLGGRVEVATDGANPGLAASLPTVVHVVDDAPPLPATTTAAVAVALPRVESEGVLQARPTPAWDTEPSVAASVVSRPVRWPALVVLAWLVGAVAALGSLVVARHRLRRLMCPRRAAPEALRRTLAELAAGGPVPRLLQSAAIAVPFAAGVFAPTIVVPTRAATLSSAAQRSMLAHELAHVMRRDPAWRLLLLALERVLFFQPLLRIARRRIGHDAEYLCDAWAAERTAAPVELARCLTEIAGWVCPSRPPSLVPTLPEPRSILRRRVLRLVAAPAPTRGRWRVLAAACVAVCVVVPFVAPVVASAGPGPRPAANTVTIIVRDAPRHHGDASPVLVVARDDGDPAAAPVVTPVPPEGPADRRAKRRTERKAARQLHRAVREARRDDRLPQVEELAVILELADPDRGVDGSAIAPRVVPVHDDLVVVVDADGVVATDGLAAELEAIVVEAEVLRELARARTRTDASTRALVDRARALRDRAAAQRDAVVEVRRRIRVRDGQGLRIAPVAPRPPRPPLGRPPMRAPVPPPPPAAFDAVPVLAPLAPTAP